MEVSYTITVDDYVAFNFYMLKRLPWVRRRFVLDWIFCSLGLLVCAALSHANGDFDLAVLCLVAGVAYAFLYPIVCRAWTARTFRASAREHIARGLIGRITLNLTDESLTEQTESGRNAIRWQDMHGVEVVGECTYVFVTEQLAAIIPRHGFENTWDYEAVRDFALNKLAKPKAESA